MTTDRSTTGGATPLRLLRPQEFLHSICFDGCEILEKIHPEQFFIPRIKMEKVLTWVLRAFGTKVHRMRAKMLTLFFQKRTVFIAWTTARTIGHADPFLSYIMMHRKIPTADVTV